MTSETAPKAPSRAARVEHAIITATRELLAEGGVGRLTIEGVAERSGVAKTTIYRRWRSKSELVGEALRTLRQDEPPPDTGSFRGDLRELAGHRPRQARKIGGGCDDAQRLRRRRLRQK